MYRQITNDDSQKEDVLFGEQEEKQTVDSFSISREPGNKHDDVL